MSDTPGPRSRRPEYAVAALLVVTLVVWTGALLESKPPTAPVVVVMGEPLLNPDAPIALRFTAAMAKATARSTVTGTVRAGEASVALVDGAARLPPVMDGKSDHRDVVIDLLVDGAIPVHGAFHVEVPRAKSVTKLSYQDWSAEVMMAVATAASEATRVSVYPVDGQLSARLDSKAVLLSSDDAGLVMRADVVNIAPRMAGAVLPDGRVLRNDRTGLRLDVPVEVDADSAVDVVVTGAEHKDVGVDLLVDGIVHDTKNIVVDAGAPAHVSLALGHAQPGAVVVVHVGGVWPDELGRFAVARVRDPDVSLVDALTTLAHTAGAPADEQMLVYLRAHPDDMVAARAFLQRLRPAKLRAPKLAVTMTTSASDARSWLLAYATLALFWVVSAGVLGVVRLPGKRAQALLGVLAVAAILAGLGAALVVTGR